jgi:hypothetical protein
MNTSIKTVKNAPKKSTNLSSETARVLAWLSRAPSVRDGASRNDLDEDFPVAITARPRFLTHGRVA